jgi:hypothetical protein
LNHVIVQALLPDPDGGPPRWVDLDPCAKRELQRPYPDKLILNPGGPATDTAQTLLELMHSLHSYAAAPVRGYAAGPNLGGLLNFFGAESFFDLIGKTVNLAGNVLEIVDAFDDDGTGQGGVRTSDGSTLSQAQLLQLFALQQKQQSAEWIPGVPNAVVVLGGVGLLIYALKGRR